MRMRKKLWQISLACAISAFLTGVVLAESAQEPSQPKTDIRALVERVESLEKENLVLREDLGKARLAARTQLQAAAKKHAQEISQLNKELAELNAKLKAAADLKKDIERLDADLGRLADRVQSLEKENLVLRQDLDKARMEARNELQAAAKKQAEEIAKLKKDLAELNAKLGRTAKSQAEEIAKLRKELEELNAKLSAPSRDQAEEIAKLKKELAELNAKLEAQRRSQGALKRTLWGAVGVLAIGIGLSF